MKRIDFATIRPCGLYLPLTRLPKKRKTHKRRSGAHSIMGINRTQPMPPPYPQVCGAFQSAEKEKDVERVLMMYVGRARRQRKTAQVVCVSPRPRSAHARWAGVESRGRKRDTLIFVSRTRSRAKSLTMPSAINPHCRRRRSNYLTP